MRLPRKDSATTCELARVRANLRRRVVNSDCLIAQSCRTTPEFDQMCQRIRNGSNRPRIFGTACRVPGASGRCNVASGFVRSTILALIAIALPSNSIASTSGPISRARFSKKATPPGEICKIYGENALRLKGQVKTRRASDAAARSGRRRTAKNASATGHRGARILRDGLMDVRSV